MKKNYLSILFIIISAIGGFNMFSQNSVDATIQVTTSVQTSPPSIKFTWSPIAGSTSIKIYKKTKTATAWGTAIMTLAGTATTYTDNAVTVGSDHEYKLSSTGTVAANTYIYAGIKFPQIDYRGKIVLIVDNTFSTTLATDLKTLESDMIGDGWQVIRHDVSRTDSVTSVKALITADYNADPQNVKAVFLFGHVPVPYSGDINPDGHPDHKGAWPADGYYADMSGSSNGDWTDNFVEDSAAARVQNRNVIGDGKFDDDLLQNLIELQVGRVDLSNMPAFPSTEEQLLKQYLIKDHNYKHKVINPQRRALIDDNFGYFSGEAFASSGWRNFTAMFPPADIQTPDYFSDTASQSFLWSYGCGGGSFNSASGIGSTTDFVNNAPHSVFTMLFGSYFGDWDSQDNFLRAPLASSGWTLTSMWSGRPYSIFHHMALGDNIGYSAWTTMRNGNGGLYVYNYAGNFVTIGLMGDPTLRMHTIAPPTNLVATPNLPHINLNWTASADTVLGYAVYREDTITGKYIKLNSNVITSTNYVDSFPVNHSNYYMVRAVKLETSNSGSYYNLSQGTFDTTSINTTGISVIDNKDAHFRIYPNPSKNNSNIEFYLSDNSQVHITLLDMMGKEIMSVVNSSLSQGTHKFNINAKELSAGIYICCLKLNEKIEYKKLVVSE
jgi:hypothetical protein